MNSSGGGLSVSEEAGLDIALLQTRQSENLPLGSLSFWGRITADTNDYLVAVAVLPAYPFPTKKFYYCTTRQTEALALMPELSAEYLAHAATLVSTPFSGDPGLAYEIPKPPDADEPPAAMDENGEEVQPEVFREEHRLAFHVALIAKDVTIVPRGAYIVDATHQVIKNKSFEGLSYEAAGQLRSYFHFRPPMSPHAQKALEKPGIVRAGDFLDPIEADKPAGCFSLYYSPEKTTAVIRSFYWPGSYFYHEISTGTYRSVYMGTGLPNVDIQFML